MGVQLNQTGYMGDGIIDLPAVQRAGFAASVANAPGYVAQAARNYPASRAARAQCANAAILLAAQGRLGTFLGTPALLGPGAIQ